MQHPSQTTIELYLRKIFHSFYIPTYATTVDRTIFMFYTAAIIVVILIITLVAGMYSARSSLKFQKALYIMLTLYDYVLFIPLLGVINIRMPDSTMATG
jgi:hypothetical protein